ncbi:hypothetical protein Cni_G22818 [Canna indica]|uniref:Protein EARLY HEADING DATE 2 n=1 Tax=Canna indica TaxID=4628 RepID=A0AAQ3QLL6_9LILI|nr:hypothetical protein Cni_G22818 [Canna indica]
MKGLIIQQHQLLEENMSNLTSPSGEGSVSSNCQQPSLSSANPNLVKKRRNLPGNPDPDAEVIALSPKSLMATNRFVCEICNKGFQRDQNLQLHRRGHNLPWKLKQRPKEVRKKVYICPEATCVHHDPSRALGDLTGIKKHFSRKHGEKKWKCDKCSKKYAVQSDWKAHSKICGTKEYRCDCGTLFSRRDSFITHRAFCDALAEEGSRSITANPIMAAHHHPLQFSHPTPTLIYPSFPLQHNILLPHLGGTAPDLRSRDQHLPPWMSSSPTSSSSPLNHFGILTSPSINYSTGLEQERPSDQVPTPAARSPHLFPSFQVSSSPHLSATALLQKAAQMGATTHSSSASLGFISSSSTQRKIDGDGSRGGGAGGFGQVSSPQLLQEMMMMNPSLPSSSSLGFGGAFENTLGGLMGSKREGTNENNYIDGMVRSQGRNEEGGGNDGMTRDFLGLRAFFSQGYP